MHSSSHKVVCRYTLVCFNTQPLNTQRKPYGPALHGKEEKVLSGSEIRCSTSLSKTEVSLRSPCMNVLLIVLCHTRPTYTPGPMDDLATPIFLLQSPLQRRAVQPWQQRLDPYAEPMPQQRPACFCRVTALSAHRMDRYNSAARLNQACCDGAAATRSRCQQRSPHVPPVKAAAQTPANQ